MYDAENVRTAYRWGWLNAVNEIELGEKLVLSDYNQMADAKADGFKALITGFRSRSGK